MKIGLHRILPWYLQCTCWYQRVTAYNLPGCKLVLGTYGALAGYLHATGFHCWNFRVDFTGPSSAKGTFWGLFQEPTKYQSLCYVLGNGPVNRPVLIGCNSEGNYIKKLVWKIGTVPDEALLLSLSISYSLLPLVLITAKTVVKY